MLFRSHAAQVYDWPHAHDHCSWNSSAAVGAARPNTCDTAQRAALLFDPSVAAAYRVPIYSGHPLFSVRDGWDNARLFWVSRVTGVSMGCKKKPENRAELSGNERRRRVNPGEPLENEHKLGPRPIQILTLANPGAGPLFIGLALVDLRFGHGAGPRD